MPLFLGSSWKVTGKYFLLGHSVTDSGWEVGLIATIRLACQCQLKLELKFCGGDNFSHIISKKFSEIWHKPVIYFCNQI